MADQYLQSVENSGTGTVVVAITASAGSSFIAFLWDGASASPTVHTVASNVNGAFTAGNSDADGTNFVFGQVFTLQNVSAGAHNITGTLDGGSACFMRVVEVQAPATGAVSDTKAQFQNAPGTANDAVSSLTLTITGAATLVGMSTDSSSASTSDEPTIGTGFTTRANNANGTIGAWRLETVGIGSNAAATFKAVTGGHNFVTLAAAILNGAGGGGGATNQDTGPSPSRNRPGRGPYSRGRFYISTPADVFSSPRYTTVVSTGGLQFGGAGVNARVRTLAAAGGLQFGGAASFAKGKTIVPVGGLAFAGTSVMARARAIAASGGIIFSGSTGFATGGSNSFSYTAAGGLTYAGSAPRSRAKVVAPAGGVVFGGTAGFATGGNQQFSYTASGGMLLAGAALKARARAVQAVGGALFGGGAGIAYHQSTRIVVPAGGIIFGGAALVFVPGSSTMSLPTIYLADASAVPVTAVFRSGAAYAQTGERYVASWPSNAKVHYISGVAHRDDGAMCIDPAGVEFLDLRGVSITARGEIIVTLSAPDLVHDALPLTLNGLLCVTDLN